MRPNNNDTKMRFFIFKFFLNQSKIKKITIKKLINFKKIVFEIKWIFKLTIN